MIDLSIRQLELVREALGDWIGPDLSAADRLDLDNAVMVLDAELDDKRRGVVAGVGRGFRHPSFTGVEGAFVGQTTAERIALEHAANPGAVGGDHQSPAERVTAFPGNPASMRRLLYLECASCAHEWTAPTAGACPVCHHRVVYAHEQRHCVLNRS